MTDHIFGGGPGVSADNLDDFVKRFDGDEDAWYVMQEALDAGFQPNAALTAHRARKEATAPALQAPQAQLQPQSAPSQGGGGGGIVGPAAQSAFAQQGEFTFPPGFAGALADFIYRSAPRPVREVAVVGALGLLAGVCGREWVIPQSGLNLYIVLVARSAIGKEAMHSGVAKVLAAARARYPKADEFVCFDDFASGQALTKFLLGTPCAVHVAGEIGHKFAAMAKDTDPSMRSLRKAMTNFYSKSGQDSVAGGIRYSNEENNAVVFGSVAYSLIGETTPSTFFEAISRDMMSDGFLSRFNVIEYTGDRPDKNPAPLDAPDPRIADHVAGLMKYAHMLRAGNQCRQVKLDDSAAALLDQFELECDTQIRAAADDEGQRQMWNRAHLKALRISALLAVGDNHLVPTVGRDHAEWAINLIRHDIAVFAKRLQSGEVGEGTDDGRERRLLEICREYLLLDDASLPEYVKPWNELRRHGVVPRKYLQIRTQKIAAFEKHSRGQKEALDRTIQTAIDNGHLQPLEKTQAIMDYGFQGKVFAILNTGKFPTANWKERILEECQKLRAADQS